MFFFNADNLVCASDAGRGGVYKKINACPKCFFVYLHLHCIGKNINVHLKGLKIVFAKSIGFPAFKLIGYEKGSAVVSFVYVTAPSHVGRAECIYYVSGIG